MLRHPRVQAGRRRSYGPHLLLLASAATVAAMFSAQPASAADSPPVAAVQLTTPYPSISVEPGSTVKLNLEAHAPTTERVELAVSGLPDGWTSVLRGGGFVIAGLTAGPDTAGTAQLEIDVPAGAEAGDHTFHVVETAPEGTSDLAVTISVAEQVDGGIAVTADFPSLRGGPTDTFTYTLTVANNTPTQQTFNFAATGPDGWTVAVSPEAESRANTVSIDGGGTSTVKVTATPPASVTSDTYPIDVTVTGENGASGKIQLGAEVAGTGKLDVATSDERLDMSGPSNATRDVTLLVTNSGTAPLENVTFSSSPPKGWTVTFSPEKLDGVPAGQSAQVVATVKPAKDAVAGDYAVGISASAGSLDQSLAMRYSVTTGWRWGLVGIGLIVVAAGSLVFGYRKLGRR